MRGESPYELNKLLEYFGEQHQLFGLYNSEGKTNFLVYARWGLHLTEEGPP